MQDATSWVGIVVFLCGIYCLYAAVMMKVKGEINQSILLGRDYQNKRCKDKEGYIREVFPHLLLFGLITTASGTTDMLNSFVMDISTVNIIMMIAFVVELLLFSKVTLNAKKKYYS